MSKPAENLLEFQPLQLTHSPSLISNNLSFPVCHCHHSSLIFTPIQFQNFDNENDSSGNSNSGIQSGFLSGGVVQKGEPMVLSFNRKICTFIPFLIHSVNSLNDSKRIDSSFSSFSSSQSYLDSFFQEGFIAVGLENGLSVWERSTQKFIFSYEYENDSEYSNDLAVSDDGGIIILASSLGCYYFSCSGKHVELRKKLNFNSNKPVNIVQVTFSTISPNVNKLWISDEHGRIHLFDLENDNTILMFPPYTYYGGKLIKDYQITRSNSQNNSSNDPTDYVTDTLSSKLIEVSGYLLCPYNSGVIRIFDIKSGELVASINAHIGSIRGFSLRNWKYNPKSKSNECLIASVGEDQNILVWEFGFQPLSLRLAYKYIVKDSILTGVVWMNDKVIAATSFEKKILLLQGIP